MDSTAGISAPKQVIDALRQASSRTGTGFDYLYKTALRESGLKSTAKAPSSSATGLFQFIDQTWLATVKEAGPRHGLSEISNNISRGQGGRYFVADPGERQEILALRNDPAVSAIMAGELAASNRVELAGALGREPTDGELYISHFLGPAGAERLIRAASQDGEASAADLFPAAARANRSIFHDRSGHERSAADVYRVLVRMHANAASSAPAGPEPAQEASPFAGIIAFFEDLFSGGRNDRPTAAEPVRGTAVGRRAPADAAPSSPSAYSVVAYWPAEPADMPFVSAERALVARGASEAYRGQAQIGAAAISEPPSAEPVERSSAWGGGLFTNMARKTGPLLLLGHRDPM